MGARDADYYRALYRVAVAISSSLDPREVLKSITESVASVLGAKGCSLMLLSPDGTELYHSAAYGLSDWYVRKGPLKVDETMKESLAGRSVAIVDVANDQRVQYRPQALQEGIASFLSVPLRIQEGVIGVMRIYSAQRREFAQEEIEFAEAIANLSALALEKARRYDELKAGYEAVRQDLLEWYASWGLERTADALAGGVGADMEDAEAP